MVRVASHLIRSGKDPLTSWFPYLGEGSPQFLHYQSLGAMITGLVGTFVGADAAFRWSLFLLVALWPILIFVSGRLLGLGRWAAAGAAVMAPLVMSVPSVGYEHGAYLWVGFGLWAQLWASWTLPLAWAFTWRSMDDKRFMLPAALFIALTVGLHFETGYLALLAIVAFPFIVPSRLAARVRRAVMLLGASLLASAWVLIPLIKFGKWAAINQVLHGTPLENGYGAKRILSWLLTGRVYDAGRFPIISLCVLVGAAFAVARWRKSELGRALLVMWLLCLLLTFGRTTFGSLVSIIPGSTDIFFRRFLMGSQLAGIFLAGFGLAEGAKIAVRAARHLTDRAFNVDRSRRISRGLLIGIAGVLVAVGMTPAIIQVGRFDSRNAATIHQQRKGEAVDGPLITPLLAFIKGHGGGRVYAGLPTNWGQYFTVGEVPVFKYLESADVDEVGYTLRTASLMTDPEFHFDQDNPSDYTLFGIRYLIIPSGMRPPVAATEVTRRGPYSLWMIHAIGYFNVVRPVGVVNADRADIATQTLDVLHSDLIARHEDLVVNYAGSLGRSPKAESGASVPSSPNGPGDVLSERADLANGVARCTVSLRRPGVVVLSTSFDPGWQVTVDGRIEKTEMLAPAVIGVQVSAGQHRIVFRYRGFAYYPELAALGIATFIALFVIGRRHTRRRPPSPAL